MSFSRIMLDEVSTIGFNCGLKLLNDSAAPCDACDTVNSNGLLREIFGDNDLWANKWDPRLTPKISFNCFFKCF